MLILTRQEGQAITIGDDIVITVVRVCGENVRIGIEAPNNLAILRDDAVSKDLKHQKGES